MNLESLLKAIYAKLTGTSAVTSAFGTRIYSIRADMTGVPTYPYMTFWIVDQDAEYQFNGKTLEANTIQVDIYTDNPSSEILSDLGQAVKTALDGATLSYTGTSSDYVNVRVRRDFGPVPSYEDRLLHGVMQYTVWAQETS